MSHFNVLVIFSFTGVCYLASHSSSLVELDLSGCMSVTNKSLEALQENLLFAREAKTHLNLLIGGTCIIIHVHLHICTYILICTKWSSVSAPSYAVTACYIMYRICD